MNTKSKKPFASILDTTLPMVKMKKALRQKKKYIIRIFFNKNPTATRMLQSGVGSWLHLVAHLLAVLWSRNFPEPPFLAGAVKKGAAPAPALTLCLRKEINKKIYNNVK